MDPFTQIPDYSAIESAARRIEGLVLRTPVLRNASLDALVGAELWFKCENLQHGGAFKLRGASNAVALLDAAAAARGVVTQSSGNHGGAIALACRRRGIPATVVMPRSAPQIKRRAIEASGARIVDCEVTQAARDAATRSVLADSGASYVHPFNDARVIAGQGTAALELLQDVPDLDAVIAPISGGGLLSGTAIAARGRQPAIEIFGAEPSGAADAAVSLARGERVTGQLPDTICDGLRAELGPLTFAILAAASAQILMVDDGATIAAMRLIFEHLKLVVEPSAAITLAALIGARERFRSRRIGVILSGGNLDLDRLPWQAG